MRYTQSRPFRGERDWERKEKRSRREEKRREEKRREEIRREDKRRTVEKIIGEEKKRITCRR